MPSVIYFTLLSGGVVSTATAWTSQDWVVVIGSLMTVASAVFAGWRSVVADKAKARSEELNLQREARMEELKLQEEIRLREIQALRQEVQENTRVTHEAKKDVQVSVNQAKERVEELHRTVEKLPSQTDITVHMDNSPAPPDNKPPGT